MTHNMKRLLLIIFSLFSLTAGFAASKKVHMIDRIEPANWFAGMKETRLQIMLHGTGIRDADVTVDGAEFTTTRLDSPNYLLLYVDLAGKKAGNLPITLTLGKKKQTIQYPILTREMPGEARTGFDNSDVLYMLMPDRFAQGKNTSTDVKMKTAYTVNRNEPSLRHGGNLAGIREHLDYFKELSVTALWFTPVLENDSPDNGRISTYHGYATTDYYKIDPRFGSNAEYRQLIDDAHAKGLKVVMDMIFNHCGFEHPWLKDIPSKDWLNCPEWLDAPKDGREYRRPRDRERSACCRHAGTVYYIFRGNQQTVSADKLQADPYRRSIRKHVRPPRGCRRLVRAVNARPKPAQPTRDAISHTELHMVDRDSGYRRHSHGHISLCRLRRHGSLDEDHKRGVS